VDLTAIDEVVVGETVIGAGFALVTVFVTGVVIGNDPILAAPF
jgi:hypothetical protein